MVGEGIPRLRWVFIGGGIILMLFIMLGMCKGMGDGGVNMTVLLCQFGLCRGI